MNQSQSIGKLAQALAAVQSELHPAKFNATNPFFKSKYADLGSIFESCRALLAGNGLAISQLPGTPPPDFGPAICLTTMLMHESGEWISDTLVLPMKAPTPQDAGSALTYARRYALAAIVGIVTDEDDDGNASSQPRQPIKASGKQSASPQPAQPVFAVGESVTSRKTGKIFKVVAVTPDGMPDGMYIVANGDSEYTKSPRLRQALARQIAEVRR